MKRNKYFIGIIVLMVILYIILAKLPMVYAISQYGSSGEEVKQIQNKLKAWGYYNGTVDGIYGSQTFEAVKSFQKRNGLTADGIARFTNISSFRNYF